MTNNITLKNKKWNAYVNSDKKATCQSCEYLTFQSKFKQ